MRQFSMRSSLLWAVHLLAISLALANCGCLLVAAGAAGGAAASYLYYKGKVCETYNANLDDTFLALRAALGELAMPVLSESREGDNWSVESRTAAGDSVHIHLQVQASKFPAEGQVTRLCVRVATFGDELVSSRILAQVGFHLVPVGQNGQPAPLPAASPIMQTAAPAASAGAAPAQTGPPPLLPPEPIPARK
jgi:hypothetical protein